MADTIAPHTAAKVTPADFDFIGRLMRERSGVVLETGKEYLVEARLLPIVRREGLSGIDKLVERLRTGVPPGLVARVVQAMTTNETSFLRDVHPFDTLRRVILPELVRRRASERSLTLWSAASSSGQEAYSLLMTLREFFPALFLAAPAWKIQLIGTDLCVEMIRRAREATFSQLEINRGLPAPFLAKYFERAGVQWRVKEELRRLVEFREMNLVAPWPTLPAFDVIFLRNALIYFDLDARRKILHQVRKVLKPDGYLVLGSSETPVNIDDSWKHEQHGNLSLYRP